MDNFHASVAMAHGWEVNPSFRGALGSTKMQASFLISMLPIRPKSALYFLSFPLCISVKTPPDVFHSTTTSLQRKPGPFYCKMSRLETLPSVVQHQERKWNKEKKLKPTPGKARGDGQVPHGG